MRAWLEAARFGAIPNELNEALTIEEPTETPPHFATRDKECKAWIERLGGVTDDDGKAFFGMDEDALV